MNPHLLTKADQFIFSTQGEAICMWQEGTFYAGVGPFQIQIHENREGLGHRQTWKGLLVNKGQCTFCIFSI